MEQVPNHPKFAVIGDPLPQDLTAKVHLAVLRHYIPEATCEPILVRTEELPQWLDRVRAEGYSGFSVNTPHKLEISQHLDELVMEADITGSVSAVQNHRGKLRGHSTDALGFFAALRRNNITFADKRVLIFGAGGTAAALAHRAILNTAERVVILAPQPDQAHKLILAIRSQNRGAALSWGDLRPDTLRERAARADIVINATPQGMAGFNAPWPDLSFLTALPKDAVVCDTVSCPPKTPLLEEAERLGFVTQSGVDMLLHQALLTCRLYLDRPIDYKLMEKVVQEAVCYP